MLCLSLRQPSASWLDNVLSRHWHTYILSLAIVSPSAVFYRHIPNPRQWRKVPPAVVVLIIGIMAKGNQFCSLPHICLLLTITLCIVIIGEQVNLPEWLQENVGGMGGWVVGYLGGI